MSGSGRESGSGGRRGRCRKHTHELELSMQPLYHRMTNGVRITARPVYASEHSDPMEPRYVFLYFIRIENLGERTAQLLWRHWFIHDVVAGDSEVAGEGVIGEQPVLAPGDVHEYNSFCVLRGPLGHMEGWYEFRSPDGTAFRADIPRFELRAEGEPQN